uniref:Uncharacterized protein LOC111130468 n=1 Tax=Crassostrea virginica TaxID=6565 RepID=A0A8B8DYF1_CRAVI|nr:uncharacterized protein LOC111130468 [Crassostrea virginica]
MNIFQAVIRPFQTQTSVSLSTNQRSAEEAEREEDGFMIVAETESERTTVYASDYRGDLPPNYNQIRNPHNPLPTYMDYMQDDSQQNQQQGSQMTYNTLPLTCHSEISGVDFVVSPHLRVLFDIHARQGSSSNHNEGIQASRFSYDFSLEEKVLHDAQCMGMRQN